MKLALLGSGEFEPWSEVVDRWALDGARDGRVVILPTASAPEGDDVFDGWARKGLEHYRRIGIEAEVLPLKRREDAEREDLVDRVRGASAVYFSGGNPHYVAATIGGTPFWEVLREEISNGCAYVGCSAGAACLTETTYDTAVEDLFSEAVWRPGLGFVRDVLFGLHWDRIDEWFPGMTEHIVASTPNGCALIGIDEDTAMAGDGVEWRVLGRAGVHVMLDGAWDHHVARSGFRLPLELAR